MQLFDPDRVIPLKPKDLESAQDNELMNSVKEGDLNKMGLLFERYNGELFGYFYRMTNDAPQSEDLVQNVFYRLMKYRHSFNGEGKFRYWIYSIARNVHLDLYKKKNPLTYSTDIDGEQEVMGEEPNREDDWIDMDRKERLKLALTKIPPEQREAIVLSKFNGMKYQEIAALENCTESAIKARVRRGLMELKTLLSD